MDGKCDECGDPAVGKYRGGHNEDREFEFCVKHYPPVEDKTIGKEDKK